MAVGYIYKDGEFDSFSPEVSERADVDLSNLSTAGRALGAGLGMPSSRYIELELGATNTSYQAPANGWAMIQKWSSAASQALGIGVGNGQRYTVWSSNTAQLLAATIPVPAGKSFYVSYTAGGELEFFRFIYAEGVE